MNCAGRGRLCSRRAKPSPRNPWPKHCLLNHVHRHAAGRADGANGHRVDLAHELDRQAFIRLYIPIGMWIGDPPPSTRRAGNPCVGLEVRLRSRLGRVRLARSWLGRSGGRRMCVNRAWRVVVAVGRRRVGVAINRIYVLRPGCCRGDRGAQPDSQSESPKRKETAAVRAGCHCARTKGQTCGRYQSDSFHTRKRFVTAFSTRRTTGRHV